MKTLDKLLGNGGWSSKKASGLYLVFIGSICAMIAMFVKVNNAEFIISFLIGSGLACFVNDSVNKAIKNKSNKKIVEKEE